MKKELLFAILVSLSGSVLLGADSSCPKARRSITIDSFDTLFNLAKSSVERPRFTGLLDVSDDEINDERQQQIRLTEELYNNDIDSMPQKDRFDLLGLIFSNNMELFPFMEEDCVRQCAEQFIEKLSAADLSELSGYYPVDLVHTIIGFARTFLA